MTPDQFAALVRLKTQTNSTTFTDADMIILMRARQDQLAQEILKTDEDILLIPQTTSLAVDQREYPFPSDILSRIKRVEAKLDGTNWLTLDEIDISTLRFPISTETDITNHFSNEQGNCFFDLMRKSIVLYSGSVITVASGLKLYCNTWLTAITDLSGGVDMSIDPSTTTHGIPRAMHEIWARGVIIDWKQSRPKPIALNENESNYNADLEKTIATLKHGNLDREIIAEVPYNDGSQY